MNSFRNRLLVLIIGLIAVTQTVTLVAVLASTRRNVEARAALTSARRQGRISELVSQEALSGLEMLWSQMSIVGCARQRRWAA